jgi:hypothetical protein
LTSGGRISLKGQRKATKPTKRKHGMKAAYSTLNATQEAVYPLTLFDNTVAGIFVVMGWLVEWTVDVVEETRPCRSSLEITQWPTGEKQGSSFIFYSYKMASSH